MQTKDKLETRTSEVFALATELREDLADLETAREQKQRRQKNARIVTIISTSAIGCVVIALALALVVQGVNKAQYQREHCVSPPQLPSEWYDGAYNHRIHNEYSLEALPDEVCGQIPSEYASPSWIDRVSFGAKAEDVVTVDIEPEDVNPTGVMGELEVWLIAPNGESAIARSAWWDSTGKTADIQSVQIRCSGRHYLHVYAPRGVDYCVSVAKR